jgi:catecholate siderophore receptor
MQGMADVVRYIPGATMGQGEGHRDAPTIRGNSSTADFFVDGLRDDAQYLRDLYNVERVEALKGSNAMMFGRGGGGGVINRVRREASWLRTGTVMLEGGSFDHRRGTIDVGGPVGSRAALRLDGLYQRSGGFRDLGIRRRGVTPTATLLLGAGTVARFDYEYFEDDRRVDRGIPSFLGRPSNASRTTFFGDPDQSRSHIRVDAAGAALEREFGGGLTLRHKTRYTAYDKFYQNVYPGAVDATGAKVSILGYNNDTDRSNLISQTDLVATRSTGSVDHTLLLGFELSRQNTENFRRTGYFNGTATSASLPFDQPTSALGVSFRQSATDADSRNQADVGALYLQDQLALSKHWRAIAGIRVDHFAIDHHDNRTNKDLRRDDDLVSPRLGLLFKPVESASFYASYGVSHLPSSGDQFSSLTATTQTLEPERFRNYEVGAKWDVRESMSLTAAVFQLDRSNSAVPDPANPSRSIQTGAQRTRGYELGAAGDVTRSWQVIGGYSSQIARIRSRTASGAVGATVPLVPPRTISLWNKVQLARSLGSGIGVVHQARMYAALDNSVTLPAFTRLDGALFFALPWHSRLQLNVENLFDTRYYSTSHGNNNIMPGASRTVRLSMSAGL